MDLSIDNGNQPYLYRVPGSWGFSPAPLPWARFLAWQLAHAADGYEPDDVTFRGRRVRTCTALNILILGSE